MSEAGIFKRVLTVCLLLVVVSLTVGAVLGQPVGLAYVETGSMEPKLAPGDGFIAVPTFVAASPEPGDVVTFDAVNINSGGLVTHRIIEERSAGYITKGDANPVPDQAGAEPPVQDSQIKATALQFGGEIVVIPQLGAGVLAAGDAVEWAQQQLASLLGTRAVLGTQGIAYLLLGFGFVSYVFASFLERSSGRDRSRRVGSKREVVTARTVIVTMVLVLVVILTAAMILPGGAQEFQFVSSESGGPGSNVILQGTTQNASFSLPSNGIVPVVAVLETTSTGISTNRSAVYVPGGTEKRVTVTIQAPEETGNYVRTMTEHRYFAFLPMSVIVSLYEIHAWLPIVAINALTGTLFVLTAVLIIGLDPIRIGRRQTNVSLSVRLRRWLE